MNETDDKLHRYNGNAVKDCSDNYGQEQRPSSTTKKEFVEIEMLDHHALKSTRQPILRKLLSPILILMKVFGLYYEENCQNFGWNLINKVYVYFILVLLTALLGQSVAGFFYVGSTNGYYAVALEMVFKIKCVGQALSMIYICHKKSFWILVADFDTFLSGINICKCLNRESRFRKSLWKWLAFFIVFVLSCCVISISMTLFPTTQYIFFEKILSKPFAVTTLSRVFKTITNIFLFAAWFLPVALCGILSQSIFYLFDEFYRYMEAEKGDSTTCSRLCVKLYIKEIRQKFFRLSELSEQLDTMFTNILMISYLIDVIVVCFVLRLGIYTFTDVWGKLYIFTWLTPPLFSLVSLSHHASKLYDKGQEMVRYVQFFNTTEVTLEAKMQFDMLLFHLNTEPVVMTIWKMIPLYRSIVISIFVSIVTYFALIVSLV